MEQIKGAKYDEGKPRPSLVPVEAIEAIMHDAEAKELNEAAGERWDKMVQSALNNPIAKDIHVDWVWTGPGPDPRGEEGDYGPGVTKEASQCEDASGRGND
jgi:hypothetical protein